MASGKHTEKQESSGNWKKSVILYLHDLLYMLVAILLVFLLFFRVIVVSGDSMYATLLDGDYLLLLGNLFYQEPERNDIVVISKKSFDDGKPIVKRVIATEGQTVRIQYYENMDALVYVDDELYEVPTDVYLDHNVYNNASALQEYEFYYLNYNPDGTPRDGYTPNPNYDWENKVYEVTVPEGHCFVMGDNRYNSADSRLNEIGCVPNKYVKSKILFKVFPFEPLYND